MQESELTWEVGASSDSSLKCFQTAAPTSLCHMANT